MRFSSDPSAGFAPANSAGNRPPAASLAGGSPPPPTNLRVTHSDIARVAGVHNTTVSLALRNSPSIRAETRQRIQALADKMGYSPDPALQALVAYRKRRMAKRNTEILAYVTDWTSRWGWQEIPGQAKFYQGAVRSAERFGAHLEHFWLGEPGMNDRCLNKVLFHRGVTGVILAAHRPTSSVATALDLDRLVVAKIGCFPREPAIARIDYHAEAAVRSAMDYAIATNHRRIGLAISPSWDLLLGDAFSSAFTIAQTRLPKHVRIPILDIDRPADSSNIGGVSDALEPISKKGSAANVGPFTRERREISEWISRFRPDALLCAGPEIPRRLAKLGHRIPADIACFDLFIDQTLPGTLPGIRECCERVGELAVESVLQKLQQNRLGPLDIPTTTLIEGVWYPGENHPSEIGSLCKSGS